MTHVSADAPAVDERVVLGGFDGGRTLEIRWDDQQRLGTSQAWPARRHQWQAFCHGRITNRRDLCAELGFPAATSDAELTLELYARWGDRGLEKLRGVFVAAALDGDRSEAVIVRDQLGCHPLFYATADAGRTFLFAENPRDLLRAGVPPTMNRAALADHLCRRWPDLSETYFEAIRRLPPGHRLRLSRRGVRAERYWDPVPEAGPVEWVQGDIPELFEHLLNQAVDRCQHFGQVGIFLSGGFDSISVAAVAADRAKAAGLTTPRALSIAFPEGTCSERDTQSAVAALLGLNQRFVQFDDAVGPQPLLPTALALNAELGSPLLNVWYPAYAALSRVAREEGVSTVLTGNGGDEWLGVSPLLSGDLMRRGDLAGLIRFMRMWQRSYSPERLPMLKNALWTFGLRPIGSMWMHRIAPAAWNRSRLRRAMRRDPAWVAPDPAVRAEQRRRLPGSFTSPDPPLGFYLQDARTANDHLLVSWEQEEQYHMGRQAGVWFHHPYWDADLIDMLFRTPPEILNVGGRSKGLVRRAVTERFPDLGLERRRKVGAGHFYQSILRTQGPGLAARPYPALASLGIINESRAREALKDIFNHRFEMYRAWELVNLETWVAQFIGNAEATERTE